MTSGKRRTLTWLLCGVAFVLVLAAAGCGTTGSPVRHRQTPPAPIPAMDQAPAPEHTPARPSYELVRMEPVSAPPKINVFGEFDGIERSAPKSTASNGGLQQHTWVDEGFDGDVAVDPKGQWLVFSSTRHSEHADLYLQKVDGLSVIQLTSDVADDAFPTFSPDGSRIAFCSTRGGTWDIYVMDADGQNTIQVTNGPMHEIHPSFSPDGIRLAYSALSGRSGQWELWTVDLNSGEKRMIGFGLFPCWSPSKEKDQIAYQKARARGSRWFSLWTLDLADGEARRVTEVAVSSNAAIVSPSWSPDGKQLSFATIVEPSNVAGGLPQGQQDIWTIHADGSNRRRLTDGVGICATPFWSADNRVYFVSNRGGSECIWSARVDGATGTATATVDTK